MRKKTHNMVFTDSQISYIQQNNQTPKINPKGQNEMTERRRTETNPTDCNNKDAALHQCNPTIRRFVILSFITRFWSIKEENQNDNNNNKKREEAKIQEQQQQQR